MRVRGNDHGESTTANQNSRFLPPPAQGTTDAERALWRFLRGSRLGGLKFRRQHPIPPYIADFCCIERKLIIELDGSQHMPGGDSSRTRFLHSQGWRVLRFWDHDALLQTEAVAEAILRTACEPDPHPNPSPGGRGARSR